MKIAIITEYPNMNIHYNEWANSENYINWRKDFYEATRCTVAFACIELRNFLKDILIDSEIYFGNQPNTDVNITVEAENIKGRTGIYSLIPCNNGLKIVGKDRVGALYGVYEFLKLQGYRWLSPDTAGGTVVPQKTEFLVLPKNEQHFSPKMDLWRGFDFEGFLPGEHMWIYMARNRLNGVRPQLSCIGLQNKLGMVFKDGGHFFNSILSPESVLPNGKTVWEAHKEWYGVRADGKEVTPQNAMQTQFCVSNDEVCNYFSAEVVRRLQNEWYYADRLDILGFDTWGNTCNCEKCKSLGNSTDQTLYFLSKLRNTLNSANLDRKVELVLCSYGGTCTLEPPVNEIPKNLIEAGDSIVFYPITRCYRHHLDEPNCYENNYFQKCITGWLNKKPAMPMVMGEYYDCSKFEEIPAVLCDVMCYDIPKWCEWELKV